MKTRIYIVKGVCRHFTGDCEFYIVGARKDAADAQKLGWQWCRDKNEQFRAEGRNVHASYELVWTDLQ